MIELVDVLLPNLPKSLEWVKGIFLIIEAIVFFAALLSPLLMIFSLPRRRRKL